MKQRLISSAAGLILLFAVLRLFDTIWANAILAVIGQVALFEAARAFIGKERGVPLYLVSTVFFLYHVFYMLTKPDWVYPVCFLIFAYFAAAMIPKKKVPFFAMAGMFLTTILLAYGFEVILRTRNFSPLPSDRRFMLGFGLALGWVCDTLAYAVGRKFGRKKLSPNISPNKTAEGAAGGIAGTVLICGAGYFIYAALAPEGSVFFGKTGVMEILFFSAVSLLGAVIGMIGDLSFSYIKRECGIKDFGGIMPGHGGALDRLDSVLFTSVFASFAFSFFFKFL